MIALQSFFPYHFWKAVKRHMNPDQKQLPQEDDFLDPTSHNLDERHALGTFLGKTAEQALALFRENFIYYQEDLTYLRGPAFRFYVLPAIKYLLSDGANGDSDAASTFCSMLEWKLDHDLEALAPIAPILLDATEKLLANFARFDCSPEIYGDLPIRYKAIAARLPANPSP
jgi:hypothetical protein